MLALSHTLVSATIGDKISNPAFSFILAFGAHFVCDAMLHWNFFPSKHKPIVLLALGDMFAGIILSYFLLGADFWRWSVLSAIVGGLLPDIISFSVYLLKIRIPYFSKFHDSIQRETESIWKGIISQVIVVAISFFVIFF